MTAAMSTGVQSVDEVCVGVENVLRVALPMVLDLPATKDYLGSDARKYRDIAEWIHLPSYDAIVAAKLPAIAITTPGLVAPPEYIRSLDGHRITVRVGVGIYDRDTQHTETARKVRNWVSFIRTALLRNPSLAGIAEGLTWSGEEYDLLPAKNQARTIGAGALAVDIRVVVPNTLAIGLPPVASTNTTLVVDTQE